MGLNADESDIPEVYGQTSWGTDFLLSLPPNDGGYGRDNSVTLEITTLEANSVRVQIDYFKIDRSFFIPANSTQTIELQVEAVVPFLKGLEEDMSGILDGGVYRNGRAVEVQTDKPTTISVSSRFGDYGDSYLALPVHVLGRRYTVSTYTTSETEYGFTNNLPAVVSIIGVEDQTEVKFHLNGSSNSTTTADVELGYFETKTLSRGDVWVIGTTDILSDIGGSIVESSKPVGVVTGNQCAEVPLGNQYCDFMMNMEIPSHSWGSEYISMPNPNRKYGNIVRVFPLEDGTAIAENGANIWNFTKANPASPMSPYQINRDMSSTKPTYISSTKRFYAVEYSTGQAEDNRTNVKGGPSTQSLMPIGKDVTDAYFSAQTGDGVISTESFIRIIYKKDDKGGFGFKIAAIPDSLDEIDLSDNDNVVGKGDIDNSPYSYLVMQIPAGKTFRLSGKGVKSIQKTGYSGKSGYSQPIYLTMETQEFAQDTLPPTISFTRRCDGTIDGIVEDMPRDEAIRSNMGANLMQNHVNFEFKPDNKNNVPLRNWVLNAIDKSKDAYAELIFWDMRGNRSVFPIEYIAPSIEVDKSTFDFTLQRADEVFLDTVIISNTSESVSLNFKSIGLKLGTDFEIEELNSLPLLDSRLDAGESRTLEIRSRPKVSGVARDTLFIDTGCSEIILAVLSSVTSESIIDVSDRNFGDVPQGADLQFSLDISNLSNVELDILSANLTQNEVFSLSDNDPPTTASKWSMLGKTKRSINLEVNTINPGSFRDTLIVGSNASGGDSLGLLSITVKPPGLVVNSFDFGRRPIVVTSDMGYGLEAANVKLTNRANRPIRVESVALDGGSFEIVDDIDDLLVGAGETIPLSVIYKPLSPGNHKTDLKIIDASGSATKAIIKGIGTCPQVSIMVKAPPKTVMGKNFTAGVTVSNASSAVWEFADTLEIRDLVVANPAFENEVTIGLNDALPLRLAPGRSIEFEVSFETESDIEFFDIPLLIESNECNASDIVIDGHFVKYNTDLTLNDSLTQTCVNQTEIIEVNITNLSDIDIDYTNIRLEPEVKQITLFEPLLRDFTLAPQENKQLLVEFLSLEEGDYTSSLVLDEGDGGSIKIALAARAQSNKRVLTINGDSDLVPKLTETYSIRYGIDAGNSESISIKSSFMLVIDYDTSFMELVEGSIRLSSELEALGFELGEITPTSAGRQAIELLSESESDEGLVEIPASITDLLLADFTFYLPNSSSEMVTAVEWVADSECTEILPVEKAIDLQGCAIDIRGVAYAADSLAFESKVDGASIDVYGSLNYGGPVTIQISDISGNIIYTVFDGSLNSGSFDFELPKSDLASGMYIVVFNGPGQKLSRKILVSN